MHAKLTMKVVAVAVRLLESLTPEFGRTWQQEVMRLGLATCPELVVLGALSCAMKFEEDKVRLTR